MTIGFVNELLEEKFTVIDFANIPVLGLIDSDFIKKLYNPDGNEVSGTIPVTISEMGNGDYTSSFIPNEKGDWYMKIIHPIYFSWGKAGTVQIFERNFNNLALESTSQNILSELSVLDDIKIETDKISSIITKIDNLEICSNDNRELILQLRDGNMRRTLVIATTQNNTRKVAVGRLDRQIFEIKNDNDPDWSTPVNIKTVYCWYENLGDVNPVRVGESD